ncbi:MAG TPA: FtsQ-type POTRA domain-containing protein [Candidatus Acetothermia bacterium]|nr:FtsQ-type POTRA domain-containing protein [Candidatus Acetothermia bacterium]
MKEGKSRHRAVFWGVTVGGVLITAAVISLYTPGLRLLDLREIVVAGNRYTSAAEVATAAGLRAGVSLLAISPRSVSDRVSTLPWVKAAMVRRIYPHRLSIRVEERIPVAAVLLEGGEALTIGDGGVIVEAGERPDLPRVDGAALSGDRPGGYLLDRRVIDLIDSLAFDTRLRGVDIRRIDVSDPASVVLYAADGPRILLGGLEGIAARLDELAALSRTIDLGSYESIDLRFKGEATLVRR